MPSDRVRKALLDIRDAGHIYRHAYDGVQLPELVERELDG
jgi:hypothetical protein